MPADPSATRAVEHRASPGRQWERDRLPVIAVFFLLGADAASWAARIPAVKASLHLSPGALGLALLGPAVGAVLSMAPTGALLTRMTPRRVTLGGLVPLAGLLPFVGVVNAGWQLFLVLLGWGAGLGVVDVAMNTEAAGVQDRLGKRVMSGFHAAYSVGGLAGAGTGALAAAGGVSPAAHLGVASAVVLASGVTAAGRFCTAAHQPHGTPDQAHVTDHRRRPPTFSLALAALAAVAFASFLAEGAANDWSAVYLHSSLGASSGLAALAYTLFSATMAAGRLTGDRLSDRFGPVRAVRVLAAVAAVAFTASLVAGDTTVALCGFALLGPGLALVVPSAFSAASRLGRTGPNLALVATCGYAGLLAGPALIGGLAQAIGLPGALGVIVGCVTLAAVLAPALADPALAPPDRGLREPGPTAIR